MAIELATGYVSLVPSSRGFGALLAAELGGPLTAAGAKAGDDVSKSFGGKFAAGMKVAAAAGAAAVAGIGVGLYKVGESFDSAFDTIRVGTGATGEALTALEGDFKSVIKAVPADFDAASAAIAGLNQRTGATGPALQELSKRVLEMTRLTGGDLAANIASTTRLFGDWGIASGEQAGTLDKLFRASQATGVGIDALSQNMVKFGAPLRQLGFGFDQSVGLLAKFEKEGVNAELVMGSLRIALGKMARGGEPAQETLQRVTGEIKNAGSVSEANAKALELFGARAGPDMAAAIREGRFELGDLLGTISGGGETILGAAADTEDFAEKWTKLKNRVFVAIQPLAAKLFDAVGKGMDRLPGLFAAVGKFVAPLVGGFRAMFAAFKAGDGDVTSAGFAGSMERIGNAARAVVEWFKANWPQIRQTIADVIDWIGANVVPVVSEVVGAIVKQFGVVVAWVQENWPAISEAIGHVVNVVADIFRTLLPIIKPVWEGIKRVVEGAIRAVLGVIQTVLAIINGDWGAAWDGIKATVSGVWESIKAIVGAAIGVVKAVIAEGVQFVVDKFLGMVEWIVKAAADAFGWVPGLGPKLKAAEREVEGFRDDVNRSLDGIKDKTVKVNLGLSSDPISADTLAILAPALRRYAGPIPINREHGGPVSAGQSYIVGERRPELFTPRVSGYISPSVPAAGQSRINHYEFTGPIQGLTLEQVIAAAEARTRLASLAGEG